MLTILFLTPTLYCLLPICRARYSFPLPHFSSSIYKTNQEINMKLRISLLFVLAVLINSQFMLAQAKGGKSPEQVKAEVLKRGTGEKTKVKVKLRNGSEVRGYISNANQDTFDVHGKNGETVTLAYADVISV